MEQVPRPYSVRLRDRLAAYHGVQPEQLFVANGSNEVLQTILLAYAGPGRRVVVFEPGYQMHVQIARFWALRSS